MLFYNYNDFRMHRYFECSNECFVLALIYIDRIVKVHDEFTVSTLNVHRYVYSNKTMEHCSE